jgi:phospholipase C
VGVTNAGGCDAPRGTQTILSGGGRGPRPCFGWKTMADLLDAAKVSWKSYTLLCTGRDADAGCFRNAFETIKAVRYGKYWSRNVSVPNSSTGFSLR